MSSISFDRRETIDKMLDFILVKVVEKENLIRSMERNVQAMRAIKHLHTNHMQIDLKIAQEYKEMSEMWKDCVRRRVEVGKALGPIFA